MIRDGWTRDEIRRILKHSRGAIDRAIILVMASSGVTDRRDGVEVGPYHTDLRRWHGKLREGK